MILVLSELDVSGNEHDFLRFCVFIGNRRIYPRFRSTEW